MSLPLAAMPIASTREVDEAESALCREVESVRVSSVADPHAFRLDMNGVHLGRTTLAYNRFGTDTVVDAHEISDAVVLALGTGPASTVQIDGEPVLCENRGAVLCPGRVVLNHRPAGGGVLLLKAELPALEERLQEVLDRRPGAPILFDRSVDLATGAGAHALQLAWRFVSDVDRDPAIVDHPILRRGLDDLLTSLLLALPNSYSEELLGGPRHGAAPGLVRRAEEYIEAHAHDPITVSDIVAACGSSRRTLFRSFQQYRGYTPMEFLTERRLLAARRALREGVAGDTVATVAYASGFSHPGRFSEAYRKRFGETPSETKRRA